MRKKEDNALQKLNDYSNRLYDESKNLSTEDIFEKQKKIEQYMDSLVITECKRLGITIPVNVEEMFIEISIGQRRDILAILKQRVEQGGLMSDILEEFDDDDSVYVIPTFNFIQISSFFPSNVSDELFAFVFLCIEAATWSGLTLAHEFVNSSKEGEDLNLVELLNLRYDEFSMDQFLANWIRLGFKNTSVDWDKENRLVRIWENLGKKIPLEGIVEEDNTQVVIPDGLILELLSETKVMADEIEEVLLVAIQYGFYEAFETVIEDQQIATLEKEEEEILDKYGFSVEEIKEIFNGDHIWTFLRGMIEGELSRVEETDGKATGLALHFQNINFAQKVMEELREREINLTKSNILEGKDKVYLFIPGRYIPAIYKHCFTEIEDTPLKDEYGNELLNDKGEVVTFKEIGNKKKLSLLSDYVNN